jgi:hypothetical protein
VIGDASGCISLVIGDRKSTLLSATVWLGAHIFRLLGPDIGVEAKPRDRDAMSMSIRRPIGTDAVETRLDEDAGGTSPVAGGGLHGTPSGRPLVDLSGTTK